MKTAFKILFAGVVWSIIYALCVYPVFTEMVSMNPPLTEHPMSQVHVMAAIFDVLGGAALATLGTYVVHRRLWPEKSNRTNAQKN